MRVDWIQSALVMEAPDWRPTYHFSPARELCKLGRKWPKLGEIAESILDGWRVSTNPASKAYDEKVESAPIYRLRHIDKITLHTEAEHWKKPEVTDKPFCVQPNDVVVRKVGKVQAALVSDLHRHHPVDANLAIVRGLNPIQALWVTYCFNQPIYRAFLEARENISALIRVGIKQIAEMPIAPKPDSFDEVAKKYLLALEEQNKTQDYLFRLRTEVDDWLNTQLSDHVDFLQNDLEQRRCAWFKPDDLQDVLNIAITEQNHFAHSLEQEGTGVSIEELAQINPRHPRVQHEENCKVLRIGDIDDHLGVSKHLIKREQMSWRTHKRQIHENDILISSFVTEARTAFITDDIVECVLPTEQLVTFCFHRNHGAYALLMESSVVRSQWERLATGSTQRFVQPSLIKNIVLPHLETRQAESWHERLLDVLQKRKKADKTLEQYQSEMYRIYRSVHPVEIKLPDSGEQQEAQWQTH